MYLYFYICTYVVSLAVEVHFDTDSYGHGPLRLTPALIKITPVTQSWDSESCLHQVYLSGTTLHSPVNYNQVLTTSSIVLLKIEV